MDRYMVTPQDRRSLTRSTEDTTSREKSSKTSTFHMGSPVSERIGVLAEGSALLASSSSGCLGAFRFRMRWMEAGQGVSLGLFSQKARTYRSGDRGEKAWWWVRVAVAVVLVVGARPWTDYLMGRVGWSQCGCKQRAVIIIRAGRLISQRSFTAGLLHVFTVCNSSRGRPGAVAALGLAGLAGVPRQRLFKRRCRPTSQLLFLTHSSPQARAPRTTHHAPPTLFIPLPAPCHFSVTLCPPNKGI